MIRDRLSWMRFFGFDMGGSMLDENTIRHYRGPAHPERRTRRADAAVRATTARGRVKDSLCPSEHRTRQCCKVSRAGQG